MMNSFDGYLELLQRCLHAFSHSERDDIMEEIHSHVEAGLEDAHLGVSKEERMAKVMSELGDPTQMANAMKKVYQRGSWMDVLLALATLVPVGIAELINDDLMLLVTPVFLAVVIIGARRGWPLWSWWWLGWMIYVAQGLTVFLGSAAVALLVPDNVFGTLLDAVLAGFLLVPAVAFVGLVLWLRGDGLMVAFTMLPWALESTRFFTFERMSGDKLSGILLVRVASFVIYAGVVAVVFLLRPHWKRWLAIILGALAYLTTAMYVSWPALAVFLDYPGHLTAVVLLATFGPILGGLALDIIRITRYPKRSASA